MTDLLNNLDNNGLLSINEEKWLREHLAEPVKGDSVLSILKNGFLQDIPRNMHSLIDGNSNGFVGIADRTLAYPNPNGTVILNLTDYQIDSLVKVNKKLVDILTGEGFIPKEKSDSIRTLIETRAVVFKFDVIRGIQLLN
jgi:hypothetical protein